MGNKTQSRPPSRQVEGSTSGFAEFRLINVLQAVQVILARKLNGGQRAFRGMGQLAQLLLQLPECAVFRSWAGHAAGASPAACAAGRPQGC